MIEFKESKSPKWTQVVFHMAIPRGSFILLLDKVCKLPTYSGSEFTFDSESFCICRRTSPFSLIFEALKQWCQKEGRNIGEWEKKCLEETT